MLVGNEVTIAMLKDENYILQMKLELALASLTEISKSTTEANPWTIVPTSDSVLAKRTLKELDNVGKTEADTLL